MREGRHGRDGAGSRPLGLRRGRGCCVGLRAPLAHACIIQRISVAINTVLVSAVAHVCVAWPWMSRGVQAACKAGIVVAQHTGLVYQHRAYRHGCRASPSLTSQCTQLAAHLQQQLLEGRPWPRPAAARRAAWTVTAAFAAAATLPCGRAGRPPGARWAAASAPAAHPDGVMTHLLAQTQRFLGCLGSRCHWWVFEDELVTQQASLVPCTRLTAARKSELTAMRTYKQLQAAIAVLAEAGGSTSVGAGTGLRAV